MKSIKDKINKKIPALIERLGYVINPLLLNFVDETNKLIVFYFHGIYENKAAKELNHIDPQNNITLDEFTEFLEYFRLLDYKFIKSEDLITGLPRNQKYIMITFDDGYFNNSYTIDVINRLKVPITIFVATKNIIENSSFWWDIIFKYRTKERASIESIKKEQSYLKKFKYQFIEDYIVKNFGLNAMNPWSDIDRPLTSSELKAISNNDLVSIENHTHNHTILPLYTEEEAKREFELSNKIILEITGKRPIATAFPNGYYNQTALSEAENAGFRFAFTTEQRKNPINIEKGNFQCINRLLVVNPNISRYGTFYRIGYHPVSLFSELKSIIKLK